MNKQQIKEKLYLFEEKDLVDYEVGHRGGHYGLARDDAFDLLQIPEENRVAEHFPSKIGVYCNYLGGGLRGAIVPGGYDKDVQEEIAKKIDAFCQACKERYEDIEKSWADDPESPVDEWNEMGTDMSRNAGIVSAY